MLGITGEMYWDGPYLAGKQETGPSKAGTTEWADGCSGRQRKVPTLWAHDLRMEDSVGRYVVRRNVVSLLQSIISRPRSALGTSWSSAGVW